MFYRRLIVLLIKCILPWNLALFSNWQVRFQKTSLLHTSTKCWWSLLKLTTVAALALFRPSVWSSICFISRSYLICHMSGDNNICHSCILMVDSKMQWFNMVGDRDRSRILSWHHFAFQVHLALRHQPTCILPHFRTKHHLVTVISEALCDS